MLLDFNIQGVSIFGATLPLDSHVQNQYAALLPLQMKDVAAVRQQEFIAGRYCAFKASKELGIHLESLPSAKTREPVWPQDIVGSISHSKLLALSCISLAVNYDSLGIDAEEILSESVAESVQETIATSDEAALLNKKFSAKEAFYKALFPLTREFIDFKEVKLLALDTEKRTFELVLDSSNLKLSKFLGNYSGSYQQVGDTIVTLVTIKPE
jgi:enterobactin synthetase component D